MSMLFISELKFKQMY